jgi:adenine deaminase
LLVRSGLTPLEALQTATLNPARFFGKTTDLGTIVEGKLADMVLLNANPLEDIHNTQKIDAVFVNGRPLDRKQLDSLLLRRRTPSRTSDSRTRPADQCPLSVALSFHSVGLCLTGNSLTSRD